MSREGDWRPTLLQEEQHLLDRMNEADYLGGYLPGRGELQPPWWACAQDRKASPSLPQALPLIGCVGPSTPAPAGPCAHAHHEVVPGDPCAASPTGSGASRVHAREGTQAGCDGRPPAPTDPSTTPRRSA